MRYTVLRAGRLIYKQLTIFVSGQQHSPSVGCNYMSVLPLYNSIDKIDGSSVIHPCRRVCNLYHPPGRNYS